MEPSATSRECARMRFGVPSTALASLILLLCLLLAACEQAPAVQDWTQSVVRIEAVSAFNDPSIGKALQVSGGSGFIVDDRGLVVTNNHVVGGASLVQIFLPGEEKPRAGRVIGASECSDLALVQLDGDGPFTPLPWYNGPIEINLDVRKGGYPGDSTALNVQDGIVAQLNVPLHSMWASLDDALAHSAKVLPGDSGGVLVAQQNGQWKAVAVNFASINADDQNYAIGRDEVKAFIAAVTAGEGTGPVALDGAIGINGVAVQGTLGDEEIAGVWVRAVIPGSPADQARLQPGDLITTMGGLPLAADGSMQIYCQFVRGRAAEPQNLEVLRLATGERLAGQINTPGRELVAIGPAPVPPLSQSETNESAQAPQTPTTPAPAPTAPDQARPTIDTDIDEADIAFARELLGRFDGAPVIIQESFDDAETAFWVGENEYGDGNVAEGQFIGVAARDGWGSFYMAKGSAGDRVMNGDFIITLDVAPQPASGNSEAATGGGGAVFGGTVDDSPWQSMEALIYNDGTWELRAYRNADWDHPYSMDRIPHPAILTGGQYNTLQVVRAGDTLLIIINKQLVGIVTGEPPVEGRFGLAVRRTASEPAGTVWIDNVQVVEAP